MAQIQKGTDYTSTGTVTATNLNAHVDAAILLPGAITDQASITTVANDDKLLISDTSASAALRYATVSQIASTLASSSAVFNVKNYGAVGNGSTDDYASIQSALTACIAYNSGNGGCLYFPAGTYKVSAAIGFYAGTCNITILGDGPKTSIIKAVAGVGCIGLNFNQTGGTSTEQANSCTIANLGLHQFGAGGSGIAAINISYNVPGGTTIWHNATGPVITNCEIRSVSSTAYWEVGIDITSAWNTRISDCFISGYSDGNWNNLKGVGIFFHKACMNSSVTNTQCNFFVRGIKHDALLVASQGLNVTDCDFIGVHSAGYFDCQAGLTYNLGSIIWTGGIVDLRIFGTSAGKAAFYAKYTDEIIISNVEVICDNTLAGNYGVFLDTCTDVQVKNCIFYTFTGYPTLTTVNNCAAVSFVGNHFVGGTNQLSFSSGTQSSLYRDSILQSSTNLTSDLGTNNIVETPMAGVVTTVYRTTDQSVAVGTEPEVIWEQTLSSSQFGTWASSPTPSHLTVPNGARKVKLTANIRWQSGSGGVRIIKIKGHPAAGGVDEVFASSNTFTAGSGSDLGDDSISTGVIPVCYNDGTPLYSYFVVTASFTGGSTPISIRGVQGTNFSIEVIS